MRCVVSIFFRTRNFVMSYGCIVYSSKVFLFIGSVISDEIFVTTKQLSKKNKKIKKISGKKLNLSEKLFLWSFSSTVSSHIIRFVHSQSTTYLYRKVLYRLRVTKLWLMETGKKRVCLAGEMGQIWSQV